MTEHRCEGLGHPARSGLLFLCALLSAPASALASGAQPAAAAAEDAAKAAYREGAADYALGHFRDALAKFELAYKLKQAPTLLFNIAQCHRQLKEFDEAATTYRSFIRLDPQNSQVELAQQLLAQVEAALQAQTSAQNAPPRDANGHDVPASEPAGAHPAQAGSAAPLALRTTGPSAGANTAGPSNPAMPASDPAHEPPKAAASGSHLPVWIAGGAAVVALGAGGAFGVLSKSTANDISSTQHSRADVDALQSKLNSQAATANVLFAVGAGLALVTGALFLLKF